MPALDDALGLGVFALGVEVPDAELGADRVEGVGDVRGPAVDVVDAGTAALEKRLLERVLVSDGALGEHELAVHDEARGAVDHGDQVRLADAAVGPEGAGPVEHVADPEVARVLVEERSTLRRGAAHRTPGDAVALEQPMDARP